MTAIALVWLLSAVHSLVSVQVVALDESHVTCIAGIWLLSCNTSHKLQRTAGHSESGHLPEPPRTCVCEYVSFQVVTASEGAVAVVTDEVLLDFQGAVVVHVDG